MRLITDAAGAVVNSYDYDGYGNRQNVVEADANPYAFTGREYDSESGLYYYRARYYDPVTGRFLQEDPIGFAGRDLNLYRYVFNNPVNLVDPFGLQTQTAEELVVPAAIIGGLQTLRTGTVSLFQFVARNLELVIPPAAALAAAAGGSGGPGDSPSADDGGDDGPNPSSGGPGAQNPGSAPKDGASTAAPPPPPDGENDDELERPDLGKPGTRRNPDGTRKNPFDQLDQIKKAQSRDPKAIESTKKSRQNSKNQLRGFRGDLRDIDFDDF